MGLEGDSPSAVLTCEVCQQPGWASWDDAAVERRAVLQRLRQARLGPAPVVMIRRCETSTTPAVTGLYHLQKPVAVVFGVKP